MKLTVNERIKQRRKELDLDANFVAEKLGISRATYYRYESKEIEKIPISALVPLSEVLQTTPAYLMGWETQPKNDELTLSTAEIAHIKNYRQLSVDGKAEIDALKSDIDREAYKNSLWEALKAETEE